MWLILRKKKFLLIFLQFYWFVQKQLFKQIQISSGFVPFQNSREK